jgi:Glycosyl transferase family 21
MTIAAEILLLIAIGLLISAGAALYALVQGYQVLRRVLRNVRDDDSLLLKSPMAPGVSIITSPPDASPDSRAWVRRLLDLFSGNHEVVVVLDGADPLERDRWLAEFRLGPVSRRSSRDLKSAPVLGIYESYDPVRMVLVDKEMGGSNDALNAGVNIAMYPVIGWVERGSRFEPNLLLRLIRPMLEQPDETVAVCGVSAAPPSGAWAARFAACAFLRTWLVRCAAFRAWNMLLPVPGAAVLVRRDAVVAAHGFRLGVAELCLRLHAAARAANVAYRVALVAEPVIFPPEPSGWRDLYRHIVRDQAELRRISLHWPRGAEGQVRWGFLWFRLFEPLLETAGYPLALAGWILGQVDVATAIFFLVASVGSGVVVSTAAVVLAALASDRGPEPAQLKGAFLTAVLENVGYRQVRNLMLIAGFFGKPAGRQRQKGPGGARPL